MACTADFCHDASFVYSDPVGYVNVKNNIDQTLQQGIDSLHYDFTVPGTAVGTSNISG